MTYKIEFHPEAVRDFDRLDSSVQKKIGKKIDALAENPMIGKPLGNKMGLNLTGFFKLYVDRKRYRIIYRFLRGYLEVVEIIGIGKREKEEIYRLILNRFQTVQKTPID